MHGERRVLLGFCLSQSVIPGPPQSERVILRRSREQKGAAGPMFKSAVASVILGSMIFAGYVNGWYSGDWPKRIAKVCETSHSFSVEREALWVHETGTCSEYQWPLEQEEWNVDWSEPVGWLIGHVYLFEYSSPGYREQVATDIFCKSITRDDMPNLVLDAVLPGRPTTNHDWVFPQIPVERLEEIATVMKQGSTLIADTSMPSFDWETYSWVNHPDRLPRLKEVHFRVERSPSMGCTSIEIPTS